MSCLRNTHRKRRRCSGANAEETPMLKGKVEEENLFCFISLVSENINNFVLLGDFLMYLNPIKLMEK